MSHAIETRVTRLLGIRYPIVQGGLARVAFADLAAAVSNAGGLGQISTAGQPGGLDGPEALRAEIRRCRALTDKPFAVNFPIGRQDIWPGLEAALEEGVRVIALT
ncbi:MAG: nitronate monooxygenase, partial [Acetobacteraceae bacterium]